MSVMGRPTKYRKEYCEKVIELGKQGLTQHQIASKLEIWFSTFQLWQEKHPDFSAAVKVARSEAQAFREAELQELSRQPSSTHSSALLIFAMKGQFPDTYGDKKRVDAKVDGRMVIEWPDDDDDEDHDG